MNSCIGNTKSVKTVRDNVIVIMFHGLRLNPFDIPKFRGYLGDRYRDYDLIHNHMENDKLRYAYPSIQFKVTDGQPTIVGIGNGIKVLKRVFMDIAHLDIDGRRYEINEKSVRLDRVKFGQIECAVGYSFVLPWMALNQENHRKYKKLSWHERRPFLENILRGNLKSLSKGLDYFIPDFENLNVQTDLKPIVRNFKNIKMTCFEGTFATNFIIPDYLGIGKQTARGFGTVMGIGNYPACAGASSDRELHERTRKN